MDYVSENENVFAAPNTINLKNKRVAFSSSKTRAKTALTDLGSNTNLLRRRDCSEAVTPCKSVTSIEDQRKEFKTPNYSATGCTRLLESECSLIDDYSFTTCRCPTDVLDNDFWKLPEELSLTKNDIKMIATKWRCDEEIFNEPISVSSPIKIDTSVFDSYVPASFQISESFQDLLDESYEVVSPEIY